MKPPTNTELPAYIRKAGDTNATGKARAARIIGATTMRKLKEHELVILGSESANAVLIALDALYSGKFQHKPMSNPDTRRDLANFLESKLFRGWDELIQNGSTIEATQRDQERREKRPQRARGVIEK